ncbi:MAG: efflux RND transporter permease subunit [Candidatus Cloacimonadaceae bacterium]|nr:efflux RND transporter permease subunit [Candidatus Cloacimonadota bacterium]MCK9177813.1 efflux RND transporter permease subunit [Candidatus Cloacimonadota bacterium]MDD3533741.1 efflux RND transporter permease subunit [Candidatus Cloacimonadota bacterium]
MFSVAETSLKYSILVNMLTLAIFVFGLISMVNLPREEFPAVDFGTTLVVVVYPGVSPAEIEQLIVRKLELELSDLDDLDYISATAQEGRATIRVVFTTGVSPDEAFDRVSREVAKVTDLPKDALDPMIVRLSMRELNPIAQVAVNGKGMSAMALREIAENLEDGLRNITDISKTETVGAREKQIWVDVDQDRLDAYGLSLNDISAALGSRNLNIPGGSARFGKLEFLVRTLGEFSDLDELKELILLSDPSGRSIKVSDVATVRDTLEKPLSYAKLNGESSVSIFLYKKGSGNIISIIEEVREYVTEFEKSVPGIEVSVRNDGSIDVKNGINALGKSALIGILLVFSALFIFLGWRNALLASFGIPLSILIAFIIIPYFDITLNNLTIFGFIIVVGMVVDNAIVVLENIHRYREEGYCHRDSIVMGVDQVIWPVFSSTLTTLSAFLPLLLLEGVMGQFLGVFPIVVSLALLGSWFQAMVVLPNNVFQFARKEPHKEDRSTRMIRPLISLYQRGVKRALRHRQITIWGVVSLLLVSFLVLGSGAIKFEFFPTTASQTIRLQLQTPVGTTLDETNRIVEQVEEFIDTMPAKDDITYVVANVGAQGGETQRNFASNNAQVNIDLVDLKEMKYSTEEIQNDIRKFCEDLPGLYSYRFSQGRSGPPVGNDVDIRIKGPSLERLAYISDIIKGYLRSIPGVTDIDDSYDSGKKEVRIIPHHDKLAIHGLSVAQVAGTIRTASTGSEVSKYRGEGVDEYPLILKLKDEYTQDLENLKDLKIRSRKGELIALRELADFEIASSLSRIEHRDSDRVLRVTASVSSYEENGKTQKRSPSEVQNLLSGGRIGSDGGYLDGFSQRFPGYSYEYGGVQEEQRKSYSSLARLFLLAILIIYTILASQFRSYVQPVVVMMTIPFAFIGVIFGLLVTGLPFSLNTLISVVALAGVVVNNAIILIDFINQEREKGVDRWNAIVNSGSVRLRPIILTTATTVAGMLPLVFSTDPSSQAWRPLAVSFTFGLLFASMLTLFIIPVIYSIVDSFFGRFGLTRFKEHSKFSEVMDCKQQDDS